MGFLFVLFWLFLGFFGGFCPLFVPRKKPKVFLEVSINVSFS